MYKWLTIMGIVCLGFIVVLLSLGYLLKENKVATTALKQKLDKQKQLNSSVKNPSKAVLMFIDSNKKKQSAEAKAINVEKIKHLTNVIVKNITCTASNQCVLFNTGLLELNCTIAVNTIGASLLGKKLGEKPDITSLNTSNTEDACYVEQQQFNSVCKQNMCQLESHSY